MELIRNKASGKFFVLLDDMGQEDFLVITPEGKVKRLERHLFDGLDVVDPQKACSHHRLTQPQVDIYWDYHGERDAVNRGQ